LSWSRSSFSAPRITILSASSGSGRCNAFASSQGARGHSHVPTVICLSALSPRALLWQSFPAPSWLSSFRSVLHGGRERRSQITFVILSAPSFAKPRYDDIPNTASDFRIQTRPHHNIHIYPQLAV